MTVHLLPMTIQETSYIGSFIVTFIDCDNTFFLISLSKMRHVIFSLNEYVMLTVCRRPSQLHRLLSLSDDSSRHFCSVRTELTFAIDYVKCPYSVFVAVSLLISAYVTIIMIRIIVISGLINRRTISGINTLRYKKV